MRIIRVTSHFGIGVISMKAIDCLHWVSGKITDRSRGADSPLKTFGCHAPQISNVTTRRQANADGSWYRREVNIKKILTAQDEDCRRESSNHRLQELDPKRYWDNRTLLSRLLISASNLEVDVPKNNS